MHSSFDGKIILSRFASQAVVSEWLRRWTRNPLGSARTGSNPVYSDLFSKQLIAAAFAANNQLCLIVIKRAKIDVILMTYVRTGTFMNFRIWYPTAVWYWSLLRFCWRNCHYAFYQWGKRNVWSCMFCFVAVFNASVLSAWLLESIRNSCYKLSTSYWKLYLTASFGSHLWQVCYDLWVWPYVWYQDLRNGWTDWELGFMALWRNG